MEIYGADIKGIEGNLIKFRTVREKERSGITVLGLASKVVKEGIVRALKAIETSVEGNWAVLTTQGYTFDLSPAEDIKLSSGLDLPIAIMLLQASIMQNIDAVTEEIMKLEELVKDHNIVQNKKKRILEDLDGLIKQKELIISYRERLRNNEDKYLLIGKLDITNGSLEAPDHGMLSLISSAKEGFTIIVPEESETHAALLLRANPKIKAYIAKDLQEVWKILLSIQTPREAKFKKSVIKEKRISGYIPDFKAVEGISRAKLAVRVALAGGHHILLLGPPGQGKTMLAQAALGLLPDMTQEEMLEVNKIYSTKGELKGSELVLRRPFQEASGRITEAALMGGGRGFPLPGLVSLSHRGILFFDEINQCPGNFIEHFKKTLTEKKTHVRHVNAMIEYPCNFILFAAMNPCNCRSKLYGCPESGCGHISSNRNAKCTVHNKELRPKCTCSKTDIKSRIGRLPTALLDRIDLKVFVSGFDKEPAKPFEYTTVTVKREINNARMQQQKRYRSGNRIITCNADVHNKHEFLKYDAISPPIENYLKETYKRYTIPSKRIEVKILLVSRTIADLDESPRIQKKHIDEAVELMGLNEDSPVQ
ncbi:MAG: ATP-binding protein [Thermodesulfovibrionales bacterium]|nr:ATP-binding protein [Thermodesulfovibrionales bacterium]